MYNREVVQDNAMVVIERTMTVKWKLRELMARHKLMNMTLAKELNVSNNSVSSLKLADTMPRINGTDLDKLTKALSRLTGVSVTIFDLLEQTDD